MLRISLKQLLDQVKDIADHKFTFIVVNDGCTDGTHQMIENEFTDVIELKTLGNCWYTKSMNYGFQEAMNHEPDYVLTLNDDIELRADYLKRLLSAILKYDKPVIIGSTSVTYEKPHRVTFSGIRKIKWWRFKQLTYHNYLEEVPVNLLKGEHESALLPGRGMLIDVRIFKKIGFFEPKLLQYASDDEFCLRAIKNGYKVYVSWDAIIYSHHKITGKGTPQIKQPFLEYSKSFFNQYSRSYWKKYFFIVWNYGNKYIFPVTIFIVFLGEFYSYFKYRLRSEI